VTPDSMRTMAKLHLLNAKICEMAATAIEENDLPRIRQCQAAATQIARSMVNLSGVDPDTFRSLVDAVLSL